MAWHQSDVEKAGKNGTIAADTEAKAGVDLGENGSVIPKPKGKPR